MLENLLLNTRDAVKRIQEKRSTIKDDDIIAIHEAMKEIYYLWYSGQIKEKNGE